MRQRSIKILPCVLHHKLAQFQYYFFDLLTAPVGKIPDITGYRESAFFQHPDRGDIIFGSPRIQGTPLDVIQKRCKRLGGDPLTPVFFSKPAADFWLT